MRRRTSPRSQPAEYESFDAFYATVPRRGDDVRLGEIVDGEYRWRVIWLPRTHEVAAFAVFWSHVQLHLEADTDGGGLVPMRVPTLVNVVGRAASAEAAQRGVEASGRASLDALRTALADGRAEWDRRDSARVRASDASTAGGRR